ncbi:MAG: ABC transporter substrate-binding protein, partial [Nanoarchaeota archaeon]|nr:ABC transporter substrate-binding protein [Nanoarchaeota archaeon]
MILIFSGGDKQNVEIGIITDLTGPAAYWGTSSQVGAELAVEELKEEGYDINLVYEDYRLDSSEALSAVQKLVNVDDVDGVYAEFNPAAISAGSFLKGKDVLYIYDAAIISPLE